MNRIRLNVILLTASIILISSAMLVNDPAQSGIWISPGAFVVICMTVLAELALPPNRRKPAYYLIVSIFAIALIGYFSLVPFPENPVAVIAGWVVEFGFIVWLIYLASIVSNYIHIYEGADKIARLTGITDPSMDIQTAMQRIQVDINRSRHYQRPLSVIVLDTVELKSPDVMEKIEASLMKWLGSQISQARFADFIQQEIRGMDIVLKDPESQKLFLICPEISAEEISEITHHLETSVHREFGFRPKTASASFPVDAISFDGLRQSAVDKLNLLTKESVDGKMMGARRQFDAK